MALMFSPIINQSYTVTSGAVYTSDQYGIIRNVTAAQDIIDLQTAACSVITQTAPNLLFYLRGANFNVSTDQKLNQSAFTGAFRITKITATNCGTNLTTAAGGIYTAVSKGGDAIVASGQVYTALTGTTSQALDLTLALPNKFEASGTSLYLSLTTPQGGGATGDVFAYGDIAF